MQKVNFRIYDYLGEQIDSAMEKWGFNSRAEFFRFLAIDFLRKDAQTLPPEDVLKEYTKAIRMAQSSRNRECFFPENKQNHFLF
ncbi:MAG: hypothetical protein OEY44_02965 [Candidatus Peregrinibacteria bacterium]|nr:hypothetical protein [Candidatus Peregrinibacteria bacterium]